MLTDIFNTSLCEGKIPDDWRNASVTPVYKKAPRPNQRITTPYHSRESVAKSWSMSLPQTSCHTSTSINKLLQPNKHGFRSKLSCETQLIQFVQDISDSLNGKGQTDVIGMDFSKAFDHSRLLLKLRRFGINTGHSLDWFKSHTAGSPRRGRV